MNDEKFQRLQRQIHKKMLELANLQKLHREETGQDYIISGPLPKLKGREKPEVFSNFKAFDRVPTKQELQLLADSESPSSEIKSNSGNPNNNSRREVDIFYAPML